MKIFLDENIPPKLASVFTATGHTVETIKSKKWFEKRNGELMGLVAFNGFDVFVTRDRNLRYQQNLEKINVIIVVLVSKSDQSSILKPLAQKVVEFIKTNLKQGVYEIS